MRSAIKEYNATYTATKKDAESITDDAIPRLIKAYVKRIFAHDNEIIITGGVNTIGTSVDNAFEL